MNAISRRSLLALPLAAAACSRPRGGYRGYAFIANQDDQGLAAIDLEVMAVARRIPLAGSPSQVLAPATRPAVIYALTPDTGSIHEVQVYKLSAGRKSAVASAAVAMALAPGEPPMIERSMILLARQPRALISVSLDTLAAEWSIPLSDDPTDFAISEKFAAITSPRGLWLADLGARTLRGPLAEGEFGAVHFRTDGKVLIAADVGQRRLSLFDTASGRLITHLPVSVRPQNLCVDHTGGLLFVTGEGMDAVVIVQPYQTEVAQTVLAGHAPGPMAASSSLLFVASPQAGNVSILAIASGSSEYGKVIGVAQVGADPGFVAVTPDEKYALVLNRKSGDVTVLHLRLSTLNRDRNTWAVLTVIPVGSRPVSGAVQHGV